MPSPIQSNPGPNEIQTNGGNAVSSCALKTLNVEVPADVYWHVRKCATESRLSMKGYMAKFCREARPYQPEDLSACKDSTAGPRESS